MFPDFDMVFILQFEFYAQRYISWIKVFKMVST